MSSEALNQLVLVCTEVVRILHIVSCSDVCIVIVKRLLFDMLVFSSEHPVSQIEILCSLLKSHWLDVTTNLEIEKAHANCALPKHHINCLGDCTVSLVFELRINRKRDLGLCELSLSYVMLNIIKFNDVTGTILEPEKKAWFAFIICSEVFLAYDVTYVL